jgi:hypothetical protein
VNFRNIDGCVAENKSSSGVFPVKKYRNWLIATTHHTTNPLLTSACQSSYLLVSGKNN